MKNSQNEYSRGPLVGGICLIVASCLTVFFMMHHPTGSSHSFGEFVEEVRSEQMINVIVHGAMIAMVGTFVFCLSWLSSCLGFDRSSVRAAMTAYLLGAIAMIAAPTVSGLIVPAFMGRYEGASPDQFEMARQILGMLRDINRSCFLLGTVGMSLGVFFWSAAMLFRLKPFWVTGILGLAVGIVGVGGVLTGQLDATLHGTMLFVVMQSIWNICAAILMIRGANFG